MLGAGASATGDGGVAALGTEAGGELTGVEAFGKGEGGALSGTGAGGGDEVTGGGDFGASTGGGEGEVVGVEGASGDLVGEEAGDWPPTPATTMQINVTVRRTLRSMFFLVFQSKERRKELRK